MCDVFVALQSAILLNLLMAGGEEGVHVVFVANIRTEERRVEVRLVLILEVAPVVGIFEVEAEVEPFVDVDGEQRVDMILAAGLVTTVVVEDGGIGREGVDEEEFLRSLLYETVRLGEEVDLGSGTVEEDTALAGCVVAASMTVFAVHAAIERGVHEEVW